MNNTEDEGIETSLDMDWVASLEMKVSDTNFQDRSREPTIYKVSDILKSVDPQAYEPLIVSLGPYHRDKPHLQAMNQVKWKYLKFVLELNPSMVLEHYLNRLKAKETQARAAYSEEVNMSSNSFVEMMLLDGCFLMLTIVMSTNLLMEPIWSIRDVEVRDIFILENQLPFFLLETLYESAFPLGAPFRNLAFEFIGMYFSSNMELPSGDETFHHIIHLCLSCIDPTTNHGNGNGNGNGNQSSSTFGHTAPTLTESKLTVPYANLEEGVPVSELSWIPSVTVFNKAGIQLERKKTNKSFLDITFHNGKLEIPQLYIGEDTNMLLRNLIAYEQYSRYSKFHVTSYMVLMDYLINTAADVELLQHHEIIISSSGDSQEIATLFNKLGTHVLISDVEFYLNNVVNAMRKHRHTRYSKWRARLNHNYFGLNHDFFSNPLAVISLFAALTLFVLTVIQCTFAFLSYFLPPK